jgi:hypothetical protein
VTDFDTLWSNHPGRENPPNVNPCSTNGRPNHSSQCAIRMGVCFYRSGISLVGYSGMFCWSNHGRQHPLRAEQMGTWLDSRNATFVGYAKKSRGKRGTLSHYAYLGQRGVVLIKNFWGSGLEGDHVDLWDGSALAYGGVDYFSRSPEIWFWAM